MRVSLLMIGAALFLSQSGCPSSRPGETALVGSTFTRGDEGWRMLGGDFAEPTPPVWSGGMVRAEGNGPWVWVAPAKFHGDYADAYGGTIAFEWEFKHSSASLTDIPLVIGGAGLTLEWRNRIHRWDDNACRSFSARLDASDVWFDADADVRATEEQLRAVLGDVTLLYVRGNDGVGGSSLCGVRILAP